MPTSQNRDMGAIRILGRIYGSEVFGVLDGADFDVGLFAGFVAAEAGDPDLAVADHGSLGVDEEVFVFLFEDGVSMSWVMMSVVVFDEGLLVFDGEGLFAGVDLDGVVDERGYGGGIVFGDGLLEVGEDLRGPRVWSPTERSMDLSRAVRAGLVGGADGR